MDDAVLATLSWTAALAANIALALWAGLMVIDACRADARRPPAAGPLRAVLLGAALAQLGALWVQAAVMSQMPAAQVWPALLPVLRDTHFGHLWLAGLVFLVLGGWVAGSRRALVGVALVGWCATRSGAGHAGVVGTLAPWVVDTLHLLGMSAWTGGVFVGALGGSADLREVALPRLSAIATLALAVVLGSGAASAWWALAGAPEGAGPVLSTAYGQLLAAKLTLVALAVSLGAGNRFIVMPVLASERPAAPGAVAAARGRFALILRIEALVLGAALVLASMLSQTATPAAP